MLRFSKNAIFIEHDDQINVQMLPDDPWSNMHLDLDSISFQFSVLCICSNFLIIKSLGAHPRMKHEFCHLHWNGQINLQKLSCFFTLAKQLGVLHHKYIKHKSYQSNWNAQFLDGFFASNGQQLEDQEDH